MSSYLSVGSDWTISLIEEYDKIIAEIAANEYKLDFYQNQLEIISSEQMMDAYSSVGMPVGYNHWSFGKQFINLDENYRRGHMGLAYEIVINSNPCISYLMEENTMALQILVISHACYGHNSFFKGNYLFKTWTNPDSIIDYLLFAKNYIHQCEEKYGINAVEELLDSCHALMNVGVDRYKRPVKISIAEEQRRQQEREKILQSQVNDLWRTIPQKDVNNNVNNKPCFPAEPQENLLYFFEKNSPLLESWQREIIRIVRKISQYFYPQRQTKVMNEGWASFWHYHLMYNLYDKQLIPDSYMLEFLENHTNVIFQPAYSSKFYNGINPYSLGFSMFMDIKRICQQPTDEDRQFFPDIAGNKNWLETLDFAMRNFKDESFIRQFLSPKVIRDLKLFALVDDAKCSTLEVSHIHNDDGYRHIRELLAEEYNLSNIDPNIQVYNVDIQGNRSLYLKHIMHNARPLSDSTQEMLKHIQRLWKFDVYLDSISSQTNKIYASYKQACYRENDANSN